MPLPLTASLPAAASVQPAVWGGHEGASSWRVWLWVSLLGLFQMPPNSRECEWGSHVALSGERLQISCSFSPVKLCQYLQAELAPPCLIRASSHFMVMISYFPLYTVVSWAQRAYVFILLIYLHFSFWHPQHFPCAVNEHFLSNIYAD